MVQGFVIAIDGPVASGKGTIAPLLAQKLSGFYLDTGVFYRCLALYCLEHHINLADRQAVIASFPQVNIVFLSEKVLLNGKDVIDAIRTVEISNGSSKVAEIDEVQKEMVQRQREVCQERMKTGSIVVLEGRNTGTATFPDAQVKLFLTARLSIRAQRRMRQWKKKGISVPSLAELANDIKERDKRDSERATFPLVKNPRQAGYTILDDSDMSEGQTLKWIMQELKRRGLIA